MPEAPDLAVLRDYLAPRIVGDVVESAHELRPLVLRNIVGEPIGEHLAGRSVEGIERKGKLLVIAFSGDVSMVVSPMLTGELSLVGRGKRALKSTVLAVNLASGKNLRYSDAKRMGQIYYVNSDAVGEITRVSDQGPDVMDEVLTFDDFRAKLKRFRGEVKGVITRGELVAGIGNAYADEVLWAAGIFPFRKVTRLDEHDLVRLHDAIYRIPADAVAILRRRFGDGHPRKDRRFLSVHGKAGKPCPKCGGKISSVMSRQRDTNFCRKCQPGNMFE